METLYEKLKQHLNEPYLPIILDGAFNPEKPTQEVYSYQVPLLTKAVKNSVLKRDHDTCRFCGFYSTKYQEVLISDSNIHNLDTLFTACIFCHQSFNLELVSQLRSGVLIWLPEVDQASLHHIARDIYLARIGQGENADKANKILGLLLKLNKDNDSTDSPKSHREEVCSRLGADDPAKFVEQLRDTTKREDPEFTLALSGLRLLPLDRRIIQDVGLEYNQFPQILAFWRSKHGPLIRSKNQDFIWLDYMLKALGLIEESA